MLRTDSGSTGQPARERLQPRISADPVGVLVRAQDGTVLEMPGRDISSSGICLEPGRWTVSMLWPQEQPAAGETLDIQLLLPRNRGMGDYEIDIHCRLIRLVRLSERRYEIGLAFLDIASTCREVLAGYIGAQIAGPHSEVHH